MKLTLISHELCPYVQRAAIALAEKGVPFGRIDIDLANKPDWFLALSPTGRVPLLRVDDAVLFESAVIAEFVDETHAPPLHPADPLTRAQHRAWIEFASAALGDLWALQTVPAASDFAAAAASLAEKFRRMDAAVALPLFAGERFSLVDAAWAPVFRYFTVLDGVPGLSPFAGLDRLSAWRAALADRASIRGAVVADYPARLRRFIASRDGHLAQALLTPAA